MCEQLFCKLDFVSQVCDDFVVHAQLLVGIVDLFPWMVMLDPKLV